jgi:acetyl esterase/lipase
MITLLSVFFAVLATQLHASAKNPMIKLWPTSPPHGWKRSDVESSEREAKQNFLIVKNVSEPTLEIFQAPHASAHAPTVIVCPGGGYYIEAIEHEGWEIAQRLNTAGINAAVLKYRLPNRDTDHPLHQAPLEDAQRAIRLLRSKAVKFGFDPMRIGILGFSAGGHLAAVTSNEAGDSYSPIDEADSQSAHPDFTVLIYPAYLDTDGKPILNSTVSVTAKTPPVFIAQTMDDPIHIEGAVAYALACKNAGVEAELHLFPKGGHGYGLRSKTPGISEWPDLLIAWIKRYFPA